MIVERSSVVAAAVPVVWERIASVEGIRDELRPWLSMSMPKGAGVFTVDTVPVGQPIGKAWLLLFGVVPFDYDDLMIAELEPGHRFLERSTMFSMRRWEHERTLTDAGIGRTRVHDRLSFEGRITALTPLLGPVVRALFTHRHRRLARHFSS